MNAWKERSNDRGSRSPKVLIAGLGNLLLRDDGVGIHAVKQFQAPAFSACLAVDVGCAVFDALHLFEWADKILLIDAMEAGGAPGSVYKVGIDNIDGGGVSASLHELSVVHALRMIRNSCPKCVSLIGIEPEIIDYGLELSSAVKASIPTVLKAGMEIVEGWMEGQKVSLIPDTSDEFIAIQPAPPNHNNTIRKETS
jgi:hydrogenase maturation protease